ncbi:1-phosphofructokinase [candidate division WOR-3 bacterium]|nr:1-phosphofructokinase [candidate division WOR-3 bacterium]
MIYTVTLNPALDRTLQVESLAAGQSNRIRSEARYAGGKGIDVSRALREMGSDNVALGLVGGFDGKELEGRLLLSGVACRFMHIANETRTNIIIQDESGTETALLARGPEVQPAELMDFLDALERSPDMDFLVISGSLPPGLTPEVYSRMIAIGNQRRARVVLDTAGEALRQSIRAHPAIIKPNRSELAELSGRPLPDAKAVAEYAKELLDRVDIVLASLGPDGIVMVTRSEAVHARPPQVPVKSTVGAGDCAVAGFVHGMALGESNADALRRAVAAGTAATLNAGTGLCRCADIDELLPQVTVEEVKA